MRWSTELWDGFDRLSDYFHDGIEFYEKYEKFLKERCSIETTYAKNLKKLIKNYDSINQKKFIKEQTTASSADDINKLTFLNSFVGTLNELKDIASQHELIVENIQKKLIEKLNILVKSFKDDRRKCIEDRDRHLSAYQSSDDLLKRAKLKYESAFKEAEKAKELLNRIESDDSSSRLDIRKQQTIYEQKLRQCDAIKAEYANRLVEANKVKTNYYEEQLPSVLNQLQTLEEKRLNSFRDFLKESVSIETEIIPRIERCYKEMIAASDKISVDNDIDIVIQLFKTGYKIPADHVFEDLGEPSVQSNVNMSTNGSSNSNSNNNGTLNSKTISFTSISSNGKSRDKKYGTLNPLKKMGFLKSKNEIDSLYDLAPQQQKKELQKKIDAIKNDILKEQKEREGLMKLKEIYTKNQKFGDSQSALAALKQNEEKLNDLNQQLTKYQDLYQEVELNGGISKTSATLFKQKSATLGKDGKLMTMTRSTSQASINSNNTNVNNSIPGTPISQHSSQNSTSLLNSANSRQQASLSPTPVKTHKYSGNESFDDDDDDYESNTGNNSNTNVTTPVKTNGNYDIVHSKLTKAQQQQLNLKQTKQYSLESQYEPVGVDSPPLTGNSVSNYQQSHDFDVDEPIIGRALVIYEFQGTVQNAISIIENETLNVLERDSGDGWTLVKRLNGEKGYVPTDYIRVEYF